jgi:acetyl-CoA carboxylase biotin carboxyl carrier protein
MGEAIESDPGLLDATDESDSADGDGHHALRSPLTGIFYRSASPDSPPFVQVGDEVAEGQTVGLIEAMKVFSEIPSDAGGRVVRIIAEPGVLISQGDVLMTIDSAAAPV